MRRALLLPLGVGLVLGLAVGVWSRFRPQPPPPTGPRLAWVFEAPRPGFAVAAPVVGPDAVYLAAGHAQGFRLAGAVYALDPATGKRRWTFDRDGEMLPTASTPVLHAGRLLFGEGMHANFVCRFYALDAATGKEVWTATTGDHIEGGPTVAEGVVYLPAGNDGVVALDSATGQERWRFTADLHIDSTPCLADGRLFVGSGPSRKSKTLQVVGLDAGSGKPLWRSPVNLPAWGSPTPAGGRVFVGLGNGRLTEPAKPPDSPAGALACFDTATGAELWTFPVGDAVFGRPVVAGDRVVFGSRDGHVRGVSFEGKELFRLSLGGPVMASPELAGGRVYAVSVPGRVVCLDPADGREVWRQELGRKGIEPHVYSAPRVEGRRMYVAAEMRPGGTTTGVATLLCFELPDGP